MFRIALIRWTILLAVGALLFYLKSEFGLRLDGEFFKAGNLIGASSILAGIIVAYVMAKIFQLSQRKFEDDQEFEILSDQLTNYRKLLFRLLKSPNFWTKFDDIVRLKKKYPKLTFTDIHSEEVESKESQDFWKNEENFSATTADLYLAMECVTGPIETIEDIEEAKSEYSTEWLKKMLPALSQIWFYLEEKFARHTAGLINDQGIWEPYQDSIRNLTARIDKRLKRKSFDRTIVAEMASNFQEEHIPRMLTLKRVRKTKITRSLTSLILTLATMLIAGTAIPLAIELFTFDNNLVTEIAFWCTIVVIGSVINLIIDLFLLLYRDFFGSETF
ncbi:hypothetical protein [Luteibaculum oceani]|uniref:Uncharacterized protein n=1 Tax=Luteibaculum oceani TaxID=1294296 RepID=A0A5C6V0D5_9FLAO|nr:hypothetical protein [Luteibaculum oceani]TXC78629.1 hypothetical protein FRX97_07895 [Luteibaculum oceani]